jgi:hypothetical protein
MASKSGRDRFINALSSVVLADKVGKDRFGDVDTFIRYCTRFGTLESLVAQRETLLGTRSLIRADFLRDMARWLVSDVATQYMRLVVSDASTRSLPKAAEQQTNLFREFVESPLNGSPLASLMTDMRLMGSQPAFSKPSDNVIALSVLDSEGPSIEFQVLHAWLLGDFFFGFLPGLTLPLFSTDVDELDLLPIGSVADFQGKVLSQADLNSFSHALATNLMETSSVVLVFRQSLRQDEGEKSAQPQAPARVEESSTGDVIGKIRVPRYKATNPGDFYNLLLKKIDAERDASAVEVTTDPLDFGSSNYRETTAPLPVLEATLPSYLLLQTLTSLLAQLALAFAKPGEGTQLISQSISEAGGLPGFAIKLFTNAVRNAFQMFEPNDLVLYCNLADPAGLARFLKLYTAYRRNLAV